MRRSGVVRPAYSTCKVECRCGHTFVTTGRQEVLRVERCEACWDGHHQRFVDCAEAARSAGFERVKVES